MFPRMRLSSPMVVRCIWALMAAVHAPALVGVWRSCITSGFAPERLGGCLALTLSMVFFALKLLGVGFLRVRPGARSWIAMALVVALIHIDVIRPEDAYPLLSETAVVVATASIAVTLPRMPRLFRAFSALCAASSDARTSSLQSAGTIWLDEDRPRCTVLSDRLFLLRAPPV